MSCPLKTGGQVRYLQIIPEHPEPAITPFDYEDHEVRTITKDGEPWFVAKDVAEVLGYVNLSRDVERHCKYVEILKSTETVPLDIPPRGLQIIPESDLYRLIIKSRLAGVEQFEAWVMEEVLPLYLAKSSNVSTLGQQDVIKRKDRLRFDYINKEENMEPVSLVATIGTCASTLKTVVGLFKDVKTQVSEGKGSEALGSINDAEGKVSELLASLIEIQTSTIRIQDENRRLTEKLRARDDWSERLNEYVKTRTDGRAVVYQHTGDIGEYACPACIETRRGIFPLQDQNTYGGNSQCPECKSMYNTRERAGITGAKLI
ncbi:BRO-N domain-containing protein [Desulfogranum mediterraneum]|uniref:BRO-N domain-containing protein n=1 Tax=Desulfogranum mediterraneum TaxID=160661 RepID=UPI0004273B82|nr:BRO family protein [Desulfogranum mediterraneum]